MGKNRLLWVIVLLSLVPITFVVVVAFLKYLGVYSDRNLGTYLLASCIPSVMILLSGGKVDADAGQRKRVQNSGVIPKEYLRQRPQRGDIILGQRNGRYVCTSIRDTDTHYSIIGTSGTGKTSCYLINNIILNDDSGMFILDVKDSELYRKTARAGDEQVEMFNPSIYDGSTFGFDVFYRLKSEGYSDYVLLETLQLIANSLVVSSGDEKNRFWTINAKNMFLGLSLKFYKDGSHDLISIVDKILGQPIEESIAYVLDTSQPSDAEYKYLIMFSSMEAVTLYGIFAELSSNLTIFANHPGVRYAFGGRGRKISPLDLESGKRIYLCVNETDLTTMLNVVRMVLDVTLYALQMRVKYAEAQGQFEKDLKPILFIIDEVPMVVKDGPLPQLIQSLRVLRSFKVRMMLCYQTLESLQPSYSQPQVVDIASNTNHLIVLNAGNSVSTQKMICDLVGTYKEKQRSFAGKNHEKTTISFQDGNILHPSDINTLPLEDKALILTPSGYMIIQKSPYYKDRHLKDKASEIARYNRSIREVCPRITEHVSSDFDREQTKQTLVRWADIRNQRKDNNKKENRGGIHYDL